MTKGAGRANTAGWEEYALLDAGGDLDASGVRRPGIEAGDGERLERWGPYVVRRPDPLASRWARDRSYQWDDPDAWCRGDAGQGVWDLRAGLPAKWTISRGRLSFKVGPSGQKQMGLFPEQAPNWDWIEQRIRSHGSCVEVLNLFAYTGGATLAAAASGAAVCHVDASRSALLAAKDNMNLSNLSSSPARFIADDIPKFVAREIRRGRRYDAIIMDPPSFGRGPKGQTWEIRRDLDPLLEQCVTLLDRLPLFVMVNFHTTGLSPADVKLLLDKHITRAFGGRVRSRQMTLTSLSGKALPCGVTVTWEAPQGGIMRDSAVSSYRHSSLFRAQPSAV